MTKKAGFPTGAGCLLALMFVPMVLVLEAVAIRQLWAWFVVPIGAQSLTLRAAAGIGILMDVLTYRYQQQTRTKVVSTDELIERISGALLNPLWALCLGWLLMAWTR